MEYNNSHSMNLGFWDPSLPSHPCISDLPTVHGHVAAHQHHEPNSTDPPTSKARKRTNMACNECRRLKEKCTGGQPCDRCTKRSRNCIYPDPEPQKDTNKKILEGLRAMQALVMSTINALPPQSCDHEKRMGPLLEWPAIKKLIGPYLERAEIRYLSEYPIRQEQERGSFGLHGRREVSMSSQQILLPTDYSYPELADSPLAASTSLTFDGGYIEKNGSLDFTESKVSLYVQSFKDNILSMHPIIEPEDLDNLIGSFLERMLGSRRRRLQTGNGFDGNNAPLSQAKQLDRSIASAMVLLVLALGKFCCHKGEIRDFIYPQEETRSPQTGSKTQPPSAEPYPDFSNLAFRNKTSPCDRLSLHGTGSAHTSDNFAYRYDAIPGSEYYSYATDILGNFNGSYNDIMVVWAYILAGIFLGHLSRPMESLAFVSEAGAKLLVILRPNLSRLWKIKKNQQYVTDRALNYQTIAFWTCLELESDLAPLFRMPAYLEAYQEDIPQPNMSLLKGFDDRVKVCYLGQLYLRTHMVVLHAFQNCDQLTNDSFKRVDEISSAIFDQAWLHGSIAFDEGGQPADNILEARLRAKYWNFQIIMYRPFIWQIFQISQFSGRTDRSTEKADSRMVDYAQKGLNALMKSTRAFHGLGGSRPILPETFFTAYVQWSNMLVLLAAWVDPILRGFVKESILRSLATRTIEFLRQCATDGSSLKNGLYILESLERDLFNTSLPA